MTLIVSIVFLPIYTKHIASDNYGYYEIMKSFTELIVPVVCIEIWAGVLRFGSSDNSNTNLKRLFSSSLFFIFVIILIFSMTIFTINSFIPIKDVLLFSISVCCEILVKLFQYFSRTLKKNLLFVVSGIVSSAINIVTGCVCVFLFHLQEESMFLALIFAHLSQIVFLGIGAKIYKYFSIKGFSISLFKKLLVFCVPLGIASICFYLSRDFLKLLIERTLGLDMVAFYSVALKFAALVNIIANVLQMSWTETIYEVNDDDTKKRIIASFINKGAIISCFFSVMLLPAIFITFPILISNSYNQAKALIPILYFSTFFQVNGSFLIGSNNSFNKSVVTMLSRLCASVVNVSLYFLFYKKIGLFAASIAYSLGICAEYLVSFIYNKTKLHISLKVFPIILFLLLYAISCAVFYTYDGLNILSLVIFFVLFIVHFLKHYKNKINIKYKEQTERYLQIDI